MIRIDTASLMMREVPGQRGIVEVTVDVTEEEKENDWENTFHPVTVLANINEPVEKVIERIREEYLKRHRRPAEVESFFGKMLAELGKDPDAGTFTRQDPNPPKPEPMEVKIITDVK